MAYKYKSGFLDISQSRENDILMILSQKVPYDLLREFSLNTDNIASPAVNDSVVSPYKERYMHVLHFVLFLLTCGRCTCPADSFSHNATACSLSSIHLPPSQQQPYFPSPSPLFLPPPPHRHQQHSINILTTPSPFFHAFVLVIKDVPV